MILLTLFSLNGTWAGEHTPESRALAEDVSGALRDIDMSRKCAALTMDISESALSEGLSGAEMLSASRLASLPPSFWLAFCRRRLARIGTAVIIDTQELMLLVHEVRALAGRRRPLKAKMSDAAREEGVA